MNVPLRGLSGLDLRILIVSLLVAVGLLLIPSNVFSDTATDNITVSVNVSNVTQITVLPNSITYTQIQPGANSIPQNVTVKNTGSANVSNIYVTGSARTDEVTNPLGRGDPNLHSSAGLFFIQNETTTSNYTHIGKVEWNLTRLFGGIVLNLPSNTLNWSAGWYRNATDDITDQVNDVVDNEFLWKVENGTCSGVPGTGWCNCTDTTFRIIGYPENNTANPATARDFSSSTYLSSFTATGNSSEFAVFSVGSVPGGFGPLAGYCVAAMYGCDRIYISKYDPDSLPACNNDMYLAQSLLAPGNELNYTKVFASVPLGTPAGTLASGQIAFTANG